LVLHRAIFAGPALFEFGFQEKRARLSFSWPIPTISPLLLIALASLSTHPESDGIKLFKSVN